MARSGGYVVDPQPGLLVRPVALDCDIDRLHQIEGVLLAWVARLVERDRTFVPMQVLEVEAVTRPAEPFARLALGRLLDLDHVRPPVGELTDAGRSGAAARQIENLETGKRQTLARHGRLLFVHARQQALYRQEGPRLGKEDVRTC